MANPKKGVPARGAKSKQEVITPKSSGKALAVAGEMEDMEGFGLENVTVSDVIIPRLTILQALSPQLQKNKPEFIKGAVVGDFCDTGTLEVFKDELLLLPCFFAKIYLEWAPRSSGKGLIKNHGTNAAILKDCVPDDRNRMTLENGNYIAETATFFVLNLTAGGRRSFLPMSSTQLKAARRWMTLITNQRVKRPDGSEFQPPLFYRPWLATGVEQSNNDGTWIGWNFAPHDEHVLEMDPSKKLLEEAKDFYLQARNGLVMGDLSNVAEEAARQMTQENNNAM